MFRSIAATLLILATASVAATFTRVIKTESDLAQNSDPQGIYFYQRESVQLDHTVKRDGLPIDLSATNIVCVWEVVSKNYPQTAYVVETGSVATVTCCGVTNVTGSGSNAVTNITGTVTSSVCRFTLTPSESFLSNTTYNGYVRLFTRENGLLVEQGFAAHQYVDVIFSPNSEQFNFTGPIWFNSFDPNSLTVNELTVGRIVATEIELGDVSKFAWPTQSYTLNDASHSYTLTTPKGLVSAGGSGPDFTMKKIAGEDGINLFESNGVVVISGSATNGMNTLFPTPAADALRIYYRRKIDGVMTYLDVTGTNQYILSDGNNLTSAAAVISTASNAVLLGGSPGDYYRNFANVTNFQTWDDAVLVDGNSFFGIDWGANIDIVFTNMVVGVTTGRIARINFGATSTNATDLLNRSNLWTEANTFQDDVRVQGRVIISDGDNSMSGISATTTIGGTNVNATASYSSALGGKDNTANGQGATVAGGEGNGASGEDAFIGAGFLNTASGQKSVVAGGYANKARGSYSAVIGGYLNDAAGDYAYGLGGDTIRADGSFNWVSGRYIQQAYSWSWLLGEGISPTNTMTTATNWIFAINNASANSNLWRVGINTLAPRGQLDITDIGTAYVGRIRFADGSTLASSTNIQASGTGGATSYIFTTVSSNAGYIAFRSNSADQATAYFFVGTNVPSSVVFGTNTTEAYRGDWGAFLSNLVIETHGWGDHATNGYLTSEADPAWASGTGAIWAALSGKATGTPVYVESDPLWTSALGTGTTVIQRIVVNGVTNAAVGGILDLGIVGTITNGDGGITAVTYSGGITGSVDGTTLHLTNTASSVGLTNDSYRGDSLPLVLGAGATATITRANSYLPLYHNATCNFTIVFGSDFPATGESYVTLSVSNGAYSVSMPTNQIDNWSAISLSPSARNHIIYHLDYGTGSLWHARQ